MTEIPEHLLKRAKEQRAKLTGQGGGDDAAAESTSTEASAAPVPAAATAPAAIAPAEVEVAPPAPPAPHVQAALSRRRIPYWVMPVLAFLPVWAYMYQGTLEPPVDNNDPIVLGQELYAANCASCHGARGGGGVGPTFNNGAVYTTWPDWRDHFRWVRLGSTDWPDATYGANNKPKAGGMPAFAESALTDAELLLIINYERTELGGPPPTDGQDAGLTIETDIAATDVAAGYTLILEEATAVLDGLAGSPDAPTITADDLKIEGEGAPAAG